MFIWISINFIYYGLSMLLPTILERVFAKAKADPNFKYAYMIGISLIELCSYVVGPSLIDHPDIGRKRAIYSCLMVTFVLTIIIIVLG